MQGLQLLHRGVTWRAGWVVLSISGFALEGLLGLGLIGIVLFLGAGVIALIRHSANRGAHS